MENSRFKPGAYVSVSYPRQGSGGPDGARWSRLSAVSVLAAICMTYMLAWSGPTGARPGAVAHLPARAEENFHRTTTDKRVVSV